MKIESMSTIQVRVELKKLGVVNPPGSRDDAIKLYQELTGSVQEPVKVVPIDIPDNKPEPVKEPDKVPIEEGKPEGAKPAPGASPSLIGVVITGARGEKDKPVVFAPVEKTPESVEAQVEEPVKELPPPPAEIVVPVEEPKAKKALSIQEITTEFSYMEKYKFIDFRIIVEVVNDVCKMQGRE